MGLILDTDHLVAAEKRGLSAREAILEIGATYPDEEFAISVMTVAELQHGVERSATLRRRISRQAFLDDLVTVALVLPLTLAIAIRVGALDARLEMEGQKVAIPDLIIGCTALDTGFTLATKNRGHFERIPGLQIVTLI